MVYRLPQWHLHECVMRIAIQKEATTHDVLERLPFFFCFFFSEWDVLVSHRKIAAWIKLIWKLNRYNSFELNCLTIFNGTSRRCTANDKVFFSHLTCCTKNSNVFVRMHCSMSKKVWRRRVVGKDEQTIQLNCL